MCGHYLLFSIPQTSMSAYSIVSVGASRGVDDIVRYLANPSRVRCAYIYAYRHVYR